MDRGRKIRTLVLVALSLACLVGCASTETADAAMRISVSDGSNTVIYRLNDSLPAQSLYSMLPFEVSVGDFLAARRYSILRRRWKAQTALKETEKQGILRCSIPGATL